ncbi:MAG: HAD family hydrolase [Ruminococcaceae bacterium]|nr:HAD family hydrolase [Oscillospiraceae bacterium]
MEIKAVIFDLDGTLTDTLADLTNSVNFALSECGFSQRSTEEVRSFVGNGIRRLINLSVPYGTPENVCEECLNAFKVHYEKNSCVNTKPYDGVNEVLEALKNKGIKTAVVTNKIHWAAKEIVSRFFDEFIDVTVGQVDGVAQKPEPDGIFCALEKLAVSKENAVYVGDSEVDCITAHNAGIPCIGVTWGFRDREILEENGAEYIVDTPEEVLKCVYLSNNG